MHDIRVTTPCRSLAATRSILIRILNPMSVVTARHWHRHRWTHAGLIHRRGSLCLSQWPTVRRVHTGGMCPAVCAPVGLGTHARRSSIQVELCGVRKCTLWLGTRDDILACRGSLRYKCGCMGSRKPLPFRDPMKRYVADRGATVWNASGDTEPRGAQ